MAANSVLIVLAPNGRRETVKVTPNTSILQVLEDVCEKQGFNAQEYDLKHYNRIVELTNSVRFSGLPNKATLEMVQSSRPRLETNINLGLQLESGKRLMHSFFPQNTLWEVIKHWEEAGEHVLPHGSSGEIGSIQPVCVYMRQEIIGEEQLQMKTLRSLGLTHGSACIRLIHRTVDQLSYQANVSAPLPSRPSLIDKMEEDESFSSQSSNTETIKPMNLTRVSQERQAGGGNNSTSSGSGMTAAGKKRALSPVPMETDTAVIPVDTPTFPLDLSSAGAGAVSTPPIDIKPRRSKPGDLHVLGEHNALLYHADDVVKPSAISIPDSFFDVTKSDVESIWRDLQAKRQELEDQPLSTAAIRNQEREGAILRNLQYHPVTVVRIRFQNRFVLQGTFRGVDTVSAVMNMVKTYLSDPNTSFYLFTSPPKQILDPVQRLVEQGLVGSAVVYFGSYDNKENYLKPEVCSKLSCPDAISSYMQNMDSSGKIPNIDPISMAAGSSYGNNDSIHSETAADSQPGTSTGNSRQPPPPVSRPIKKPETTRVPKWFKK